MDNLTKKQRSYTMSKIKRSRTKPELILIPIMKKLGLRYQPKGILGRPDFGNKKIQVAVFVNGCFWHGCPKHYKEPKTNRTYWRKKIKLNMKRDKRNTSLLKRAKWKVVTIWEHDLNNYHSISLNRKLTLIRWYISGGTNATP